MWMGITIGLNTTWETSNPIFILMENPNGNAMDLKHELEMARQMTQEWKKMSPTREVK